MKTFIILIIMIFIIPAGGQFKDYTQEDGLSQSTVFAVCQDSTGFMWFGTMDGLNRFDGYNFTVYKHIPFDTNSITSSFINDIQVDAHNGLWVGTENGGLHYLDSTREKFQNLSQALSFDKSFSSVKKLAVVNEKIILGTENGIFLFHPATQKIEKINNIKVNPVSPIALSNSMDSGTIYMANGGTLWKLTLTIDSIFVKKIPMPDELGKNGIVYSLLHDSKSRLWIGTEKNGVYLWEPTSHRFLSIPITELNQFLSRPVTCMFEDKSGQYWVGTRMGLFQLDSNLILKNEYYHQDNDENSISDHSIQCITQSMDGTLWVGTWAGGVNRLSYQNKLNTDVNLMALTRGMIVLSVYPDSDRYLWVGTNGMGLVKVDMKKKSIEMYSPQTIQGINPGYLVQDVIKPDDHTLWCSTWIFGIFEMNIQTGTFRKLSSNIPLPKNGHKFYRNKDGNIWYGTEAGLFFYNTKMKKWFSAVELYPFVPASVMKQLNIWTIIERKDESIWMGTEGSGVWVIDPNNKSLIQYGHDDSNNRSLSDNMVWGIYEDRSGDIWIGTAAGLNRWIPEDSSFFHIFEKDGLSNNYVYSIIEDSGSGLWITTNNGLTLLQKGPESTIFTFYKEDGLPANEFNMGSGTIVRNTIYAGTVNGLAAFTPAVYSKTNITRQIQILNLEISNIEKEKLFLLINEKVKLKYYQNSFSITVALPDYINPLKNQFSFYLEGFDDDWRPFSTRNTIQYTNLSPGSYKLHIKAKNSQGIEIPSEKNIIFVISPPFWETIWFKTLIALMIVGIIFMYIRIRISRLKALEQLRISIASDLHDDIGATLTKISLYADSLQISETPDEIHAISKRIRELSSNVIFAMKDLVWAIDSRKDTWGDLINRMKEHVYGFLKNEKMEIHFVIEGINLSANIHPELRQNLFLIFKEAVHNTMKHSEADALNIRIINSTNRFTMCIEDNGKGFRLNNTHQGNGLRSMKRRAEKIEGELLIRSQSGTKIDLILKKKL
ncbi:MAG: hypothetical protein Kow00108_24280 [Calditrichia bacterium]